MKRRQKGFTLKDLMIVVAIIVIVVFWVNTFPRSVDHATWLKWQDEKKAGQLNRN